MESCQIDRTCFSAWGGSALTRAIVYIDGFNLYFALRANRWRKYYWLDLVKLGNSLLKPEQCLLEVHHFTTRLRYRHGDKGSLRRQAIYLEALRTLDPLRLHFGHYLEKPRRCRTCHATWMDYEEKMTDVNIATQLLTDAFDDQFDTALLISADSDLTTPVRFILLRFPKKRIIIVRPPGRHSEELSKAATASFTMGEAKLRMSQLPLNVTSKDGYLLTRPKEWN